MERSSAAARTRLLQELSKNRHTSSLRDEDFATADSFDIDHDAVIHSTAQMPDITAQHSMAQRDYFQGSDDGTEGSADMSIEMGRGDKRSANADNHDLWSSAIFNMGDDNLYEVTGTPPIKSRKPIKQTNGALRREASLRRTLDTHKTNDAARRTASGTAHRTLSEALGRPPAPDDTVLPNELPAKSTLPPRNTRFAATRKTSAQQSLHQALSEDRLARRTTANNPTVQSTTYTANSFMLPDIPNIVELVSGARKDATPGHNRKPKSNSRFTSGAYKPLQPDHARVESVPIPSEEHALYTSLQILKEKISQLELDKTLAVKRADDLEHEAMDLRAQLSIAQRRPDSALGSDCDDHDQDKLRAEKARLQASVKTLQERLNRSEQKMSVSNITVDRVVQEREKLITQIGVAYHENEELKRENGMFHEEHAQLQDERDNFAEQVEQMRQEIQRLQQQTRPRQARPASDVKTRAQRSRGEAAGMATKEQATRGEQKQSKPWSADVADNNQTEDIALRIAREVQKHRDSAVIKNVSRHSSERKQSQTRDRSRSKSASRRRSSGQHLAQEYQASEVDTTEFEITEKTREILKDLHIPAIPGQAATAGQTRDLTVLSDLDPDEYAKLRKKIEEEYRNGRERQTVPVPQEATSRSAVSRKPSLKDITLDRELADATTKPPKSVRVQSPHTSDASTLPSHNAVDEDPSIMSNTSRRRRAISAEGMTSAFIVPDITLHRSQSLPTTQSKICVEHNAGECTVCQDDKVLIPRPVPVSDRNIVDDTDVTSATVRPSQAPPLALAAVIKQLEDEIIHLKLQLQTQSALLLEHVPALSQRKRKLVSARIHHLTTEINRRSSQVYALYDVVEGQKQAAARGVDVESENVEETLMSIGLDLEELSGRIGRSAPPPGLDDLSSEASDELPWEGFSDYTEDEQ